MIEKNHVCKRCLYASNTKANLRIHLLKKKACCINANGQDIERALLLKELGEAVTRSKDHQCPFCKNRYSSSQCLNRHKKICKATDCTVMPSYIHDAMKTAVEEVLQKFLSKSGSQGLIHALPASINHVHGGSPTVHNVTNIQINMNAHGKEDMSYLTQQFLTKCTKEAYFDGIPQLIREVHLNPEHPENMNIRGKSIRQSIMEMYNGEKWVRTAAIPVLDSLIQKGCKVFWQHFMNNMESEFKDEALQELIQKHLSTLTNVTKERKTETYYKIRNKIFFMFFEDRDDNFAVVFEPNDKDDVVENTLNHIQEEFL